MSALTLAEAARLAGGELTGGDARLTAVGIDTRQLVPGALYVAVRGARFDGHDFVAEAQRRGAGGVMVSRPVTVALPQIRVEDARLALGRLAAGWRRRFTRPVIALTGSNGKTTVKEMLAAILRGRGKTLATAGNLNNDLGVPLTLLRLGDEDYAVIEMGASHAGEIAYLSGLAQPDVALITNAGPAHLEGFGSLDGVARAKGEIYGGLEPAGVAVINGDDRYAAYWRGLTGDRRRLEFALDRPAEVSGRLLDASRRRFRLYAGGDQIDIELPLPGVHNVRNALAAAAAGLAVGAEPALIRQGLEGMQTVAGRLQQLVGVHGCALIHDAYNANPASLAAALQALAAEAGRDRWLVLGDMKELGPEAAQLHVQAGAQARAAGFGRCYALGEHSRLAAEAFGPGGAHFPTVEALIQSLQEALAGGAGPTLLIKGSRSMRMERVVQALQAAPAPGA